MIPPFIIHHFGCGHRPRYAKFRAQYPAEWGDSALEGSTASAKRKKASKETTGRLPTHSFDTLLDDLGTLASNLCRIGEGAAAQTLWTEMKPTPLQAKALELLGLQA